MYYIMRKSDYVMHTIITLCETCITLCGNYYVMRKLLRYVASHPARNKYVQARPGPQNNLICEAQARPEPVGPGPGYWPDHIGTQNSNVVIVYTF